MSTAERSREAGFSLIEVVLCVGLLAAGAVAALGVLPSLVRASQQELVRSAAAQTARNAIERVRAAVAYYPANAGIGDVTSTSGHAWAFDPRGSATYVSAAHVHRSLCGSATSGSDVPMPVTIAFDAPSDTVRVTVSYPADPCGAGGKATIAMSARLSVSQWSPQTQVPVPVDEPLQQ